MKWANVGVGKLHHPYALRLFLLDSVGQPVLTSDAKADPRGWLPGEHHLTETLRVPHALAVGEYTVALTLVDPSAQRPPFRLAMSAPEKADRYEVSRVKVE